MRRARRRSAARIHNRRRTSPSNPTPSHASFALVTWLCLAAGGGGCGLSGGRRAPPGAPAAGVAVVAVEAWSAPRHRRPSLSSAAAAPSAAPPPSRVNSNRRNISRNHHRPGLEDDPSEVGDDVCEQEHRRTGRPPMLPRTSSAMSRTVSSYTASRYPSALSLSSVLGGSDEGEPRPARRGLGMSAALFATYLSVMGAKCALPSALSLLTAPTSGMSYPSPDVSPQKIIAKVLALSTLAISVGKFLLGPVIDTLGGATCLRLTLSALAACLGVIASTGSFSTFARCWILVDFLFSACWAACLNAVHGHFPEEEWAGKVGMLAVAARCGNALAFGVFSGVLGWARRRAEAAGSAVGQEWRAVFWASALAQAMPLALLTAFGRRQGGAAATPSAQDIVVETKKVSVRQSLLVLRQAASTPLFWLHLLSRSALMVFASFLLFVPSFMSNGFGLSSGDAARAGSVYALGCLLSVAVGSDRYARLKWRGRAVANTAQMGAAAMCAAALLCHSSNSVPVTLGPSVGVLLMFLWGAAFAVPFYIPPSLYALRTGGRESSATIADAFDLVGFALLAAFNGYAAGFDHADVRRWTGPFGMLLGCAVISAACLVGANALEGREEYD